MKTIVLTVISLVSASAHGADLDGTWTSDAESTIAFNRTNARLTEKQDKFLSQLLGKLTVTYKNGVAYSSMPSTKVTVNGKLEPFVGFKTTEKYRIVAQDHDTIVLETTSSDGKSEISLLKFENEDKFWVYLPISSSKWSQLHIREYFVRKK